MPSQKGLIENLPLESSSGPGPWPCRLPLLVLINNSRKDYFRHFWSPEPYCLTLRPRAPLRPRWELKVYPQKVLLGLSGWKPWFLRGQSVPQKKRPDDAQVSWAKPRKSQFSGSSSSTQQAEPCQRTCEAGWLHSKGAAEQWRQNCFWAGGTGVPHSAFISCVVLGKWLIPSCLSFLSRKRSFRGPGSYVSAWTDTMGNQGCH